jgi:hypothetical protein
MRGARWQRRRGVQRVAGQSAPAIAARGRGPHRVRACACRRALGLWAAARLPLEAEAAEQAERVHQKRDSWRAVTDGQRMETVSGRRVHHQLLCCLLELMPRVGGSRPEWARMARARLTGAGEPMCREWCPATEGDQRMCGHNKGRRKREYRHSFKMVERDVLTDTHGAHQSAVLELVLSTSNVSRGRVNMGV